MGEMIMRTSAKLQLMLACAVVWAGTLAIAQSQTELPQGEVVTINLTTVRADIAKEINVEASQVPETLQAPVAVAAEVCNMDASVLSKQAKEGGASCEAKRTNAQLNGIVQEKLTKEK
jgi:hypothetical protein